MPKIHTGIVVRRNFELGLVQIELSEEAARLLTGVLGRLGVMDIDALVSDAPHTWNRAKADPLAAAVVVLELFETCGDAGLAA